MANKFKALSGLAIFLVFLSAGFAFAQQNVLPEIVDFQVGFQSRYKVGQWTPVWITFRGGNARTSGAVTLTVPDGDGVPSRVTTPDNRPVLLLPGRETTVLLYARFGRVDSTATVQLHADRKVVAEREFYSGAEANAAKGFYRSAMNATDRLYLVLAASGMGVQKAVEMANQRDDASESVVVRMADLKQLPTRWYGYEGVDTVVLSTSRPELYAKLLGQNDARLKALDEWIQMGGRLVFAVGANAEDAVGPGMPLCGFAPGKLDRMVPLRHSRGWESYADGSAPFPKSDRKDDEMSAPRFGRHRRQGRGLGGRFAVGHSFAASFRANRFCGRRP